MPLSGVTTWELTAGEMISRAYAKLGIPGEGNSLTTAQNTVGLTNLNMVIQMALTDGMPLWKRTILDETPSATSQTYTVSLAARITAVYLLDVGGTQYELVSKSLYDFMRLPTTTEGIPVHWTSTQSIQGFSVSIWPPTSDATTIANKTIRIIYQKEFDGANATTDLMDFPAYWTAAIVYRLAQLLAPEVGMPLPDRGQLAKDTEMLWDSAKGYDDDVSSLFIQPNQWYRNRQ